MLKVSRNGRTVKASLPSILLMTVFLAGVPAANGDDRKPVSDIYEAIRIAEAILSRNEEDAIRYANGELKIGRASKCRDAFHLECGPISDYTKALRHKLEGRSYWYIVFADTELVLGGVIGFYIDARTSELIHTYIGR